MDAGTRAVLVGALGACDTRDLLNDTFSRYNVTDLKQKIDCINECMGNPKTFFSTGKTPNIDDIYEATVQMFLTGAWKWARTL